MDVKLHYLFARYVSGIYFFDFHGKIKETDKVAVKVKVKNTGHVPGKEVVQLYVHEQQSRVMRPEKELKAFAKISLQPGEEKDVSFTLEKRDFAYYDVGIHDWTVNPGQFDILVGGSSDNLPLKQTIEVKPSPEPPPRLTRDSLLKNSSTIRPENHSTMS